MDPETLMSWAVTLPPQRVGPTTMRSRRALRSSMSVARQRMAMTSEATVMS